LNLALLLFTIVTFGAYVGYIWIRYGVQPSISASWKNLENPVKKSLYSWAMACVAVPMMIVSSNWMGVWAGIFLAITFAAPTGGSRLQHTLHCVGADVGMILGTLMLGFFYGLWWLVAIAVAIVGVLYFTKSKNHTWWIEIVVFLAVMLGLFIAKVL